MAEEKDKPVFDGQTLAKLLEAAYVLQEHNSESQAARQDVERKPDQPEDKPAAAPPAPSAASAPSESSLDVMAALPLSQIVETQHKIQARHLELESAMSLVAERVVEIARAAGAAIGIVDGKVVRYRAVAGQRAPAAGSEVPLDKALCIPCIRTGEVFRCANVTPKLLLDTEECRRRGIQSLVAVPVFHNGGNVGGLELYYSDPRAFTEQDVQTCQLMAGLITEALAREEQTSSKKSLVSERTRMLDALEKLKPNLSALVDKPATGASSHSCTKCGHQLVADEQFCGHCGSPRGSEGRSSAAQDKVASLEDAPSGKKDNAAETAKAELTIAEKDDIDHILSGTSLDELAKSLENEMPEPFADSNAEDEGTDGSEELAAKLLGVEDPESEISEEAKSDSKVQPEAIGEEQDEQVESVALAKPVVSANWSSAHSAREFLEQLAGANRKKTLARFWNERRGDIYLAIAVILVASVIRWGIWSNPSVNAKAAPNTPTAAHHKASPDADLSFFDRMLINLGLAEPPEPQEDKGNPSIQVWVDTHTALYYCPGADLYGKTPAGKYASQRDAQLDQFEPAYRKTCK